MLISKKVDCNYLYCESTLSHPLHISCMMNDYESIAALIQGGADVNQIGELHAHTLCKFENKEYGDTLFTTEHIKHHKTFMLTPLEIVCMGKSLNLKIVKYLLKHNALSNFKSANGINPLIIACFYEYNDLVEILLRSEANVNVCDDLDTLCLAVMQHNGEKDIINVLSYTDCTKKTTMSTPLHIASMTENSQNMVNLLLQNHAKLNTACNISPFLLAIQNGNYQMSASVNMSISYYRKLKAIKDVLPLHAACRSGYQGVVETLMQNKSFHYTEAAIGISSVQVACIKGNIYPYKLNKITDRYFLLSAIQIACLGQYWNICKILMHKEMNITETFDVSVNLMACFSGNQEAIDASLSDTQLHKISIFDIFIEHEQNDLVKCILDTIVNTDLEVIESLKTLFLNACVYGNLEIVSYLYNKLVILNIDDIDIENALYYACKNCHEGVFEFLESNFKCKESEIFDKETLLHTACRLGLNNIVGKLLRGGADPFMEKHGMNVFHVTCKYNQKECLRTVFRFWETNIYSASNDALHCLDIVSDKGKRALNIAYQNKNTYLIKVILSFGANIHCTYGEKGETLLMEACKDNDFQITQLLLENSANVNSRNNKGQTALCISCELEKYDIGELLVNYGADVNISTYDGLSPLYFACIKQQVNTVRLLLQNHADTNVCLSVPESLLIICCMDKAYEIVDLLLQYGADVNFHHSGETAFYKALQMADAKLINSLLVYNAVWKEICENQDYFLFEACKKGLVEIVELIIQNNQSIDLNTVLQNGRTPLYACYEALSNTDSYQYKSQIKIGYLLLRHGANIFASANEKDTSFHQLCEKGKISDIEKVLQTCLLNKKILEVECISACANNRHELAYLLKKFFSCPYGSDNLNNIFFMAAKTGMDYIVEDLLHSNFDIDTVNNTGQTALHIASSHGNNNTVEKLLAYGKADINKQTDEGYTPLHFACCNVMLKLLKFY